MREEVELFAWLGIIYTVSSSSLLTFWCITSAFLLYCYCDLPTIVDLRFPLLLELQAFACEALHFIGKLGTFKPFSLLVPSLCGFNLALDTCVDCLCVTPSTFK